MVPSGSFPAGRSNSPAWRSDSPACRRCHRPRFRRAEQQSSVPMAPSGSDDPGPMAPTAPCPLARWRHWHAAQHPDTPRPGLAQAGSARPVLPQRSSTLHARGQNLNWLVSGLADQRRPSSRPPESYAGSAAARGLDEVAKLKAVTRGGVRAGDARGDPSWATLMRKSVVALMAARAWRRSSETGSAAVIFRIFSLSRDVA